jgi:hypothetical protein
LANMFIFIMFLAIAFQRNKSMWSKKIEYERF